MGNVIVLISLSVFVVASAFAQEAPTAKIQGFQVNYSGKKNKTFENDNKGTGVEILLTSKYPIFNYFAKGRLTTVSGSQDFLDNGSTVNSGFTYYQSSFELGGTFYPIPRKNNAINVYLGFAAVVSYNYMSLDSSSFTNVEPSYQAMSFGYAGLMGVEWLAFKRVSICAEFSQRYETAKLAGISNFGLNGFSLSVGLGW